MRCHPRLVVNASVVVLLVIVGVLLLTEHGKVWENGSSALTSAESLANKRDSQLAVLTYSDPASLLREDPPQNGSAEVKLIILTYMRSGSSFTGDLFNHHERAFYVFEPLWSVQKHYFTSQPVFFFNSPPVTPVLKDFYEVSSLGVDIIKAFLDCQFRAIDPRTLTQPHLLSSATTRPFFYCGKQHPGIFGTLRCLPALQQTCRASRLTSVKTIRFSFRQAAALIERDPKVKVIHLLRDPRGTLRSQASVAEFKWSDLDPASGAFCRRVLEDLHEAERVKTLFPGRVLTARYEDLALDPLTFAEKLVTFAGLTFDPKLRDFVWTITSAGLKDGGASSTQRNDSRVTAFSWRRKMAFSSSLVIDKNCAELYRRLGYLQMSSDEMLNNLSVPSIRDHGSVPGLWT